MVRLYMDENVEGAIIRALRDRGVDLVTGQEEGREGAPDPAVLDRATELGRVLFSRDRDMLREAVRRQRAGESFAGVIYGHPLVAALSQCINDLEAIAGAGRPEEFLDGVTYLPL
jgi:hypothetical protein